MSDKINSENEMETIRKMADSSYKAHTRGGGVRGQMILPQDDYFFHVIKATKSLVLQNHSQCLQKAAPPDQIELGKLAAFGKSVWDWIKANPDFCGDEFSETFLPMAEEAGLCRKEPYNPEKHGEIEYGEPGFDIWTWD